MSENIIIQCPHCNEEIDANSTVFNKLKRDNNIEITNHRKKYKEEMQKLEDKNKNIDQEVENELKIALLNREKELRLSIKKDIENENIQKNKFLEELLEEKTTKINKLSLQAIENIKLKEELENKEILIRADLEIQSFKNIEKIKNENKLKLREQDVKFRQLQEQLKIVQKKSEQGSVQLQGEVQELEIEDYLMDQYPLDNIQEIKKGERGADCIQTINNMEFKNCGQIYYESKRAKDFQKKWIEKFKEDMIEKDIYIGVLVTQTLPKELKMMGLIDGIWICTFNEFKGLSMVLREGIIRFRKSKIFAENRTDKMSTLYNYLTSNSFSMNIEALNSTYIDMKTDLDKEKTAMKKLWKKREKQINRVMDNFDSIYGSIKGISGNDIKNIESLELGFSIEKTLN